MKHCPLLLTLALLLPLAARADPAARPSLLFVTGAWEYDEDVPLVAELRQAGFIVNKMGFEKLTPEIMAQYNCLIFPEFPRTDPYATGDSFWEMRPATFDRIVPQIQAYVAGGGGVVIYGVCFFQTQVRGMDNMNKLLAPWGAQTLFEQVLDPDRTFAYSQNFSRTYSWTGNLTPDPLTTGLQRIFYTTDQQHGPMTCTFKLSPEWKILARGEASARSVPANPALSATPELFLDKAGTYASAPPLIAVRDFGQGRVVVDGESPVVAVFGGRFRGYGNVLASAGDGHLKSDYGVLQQRLYRWAAQKALAAGAPGGYVEKPQVVALREDIQTPPVDWATFKVTDSPGFLPRRGLIGARTATGGGSGTVADYVAAAQQAGLDFVVFAQDFSLETPQKWAAFSEECKRATTAQVLAEPGWLYLNNAGDRWVAAGDMTWPEPDLLSNDGKRLINPEWWFTAGGLGLNAPIDAGHNPRPFWTYSCYGALAVQTYANGKLIDDATPAFLDREEIEDELEPVVVDLLDSPARLAASAGHVTGIMVRDQATLKLALARAGNQAYRFYAGAGPDLTDWRAWGNPRCTQGRWDPLPGTERLSVWLTVTSPVGLKTVSLMDGTTLLRRFSAGGQKSFSRLVSLLHDRQREPLVVAEDTAGHRMISCDLRSTDQLNWRNMCGDRGNTIDDAVIRTDTGRVFIDGPVAPYQRKNTMFSFFPGYDDLSSAFAAPYVDGGLRPVGHMGTPHVALVGVKDREGVFASRMVSPMSSRDVVIQQSDLIGWFDYQYASAWAPAETVKPLEDYTASVRWLDFAKRYHDMGFTLVEGTLTFLHDATLDANQIVNPQVEVMLTGSSDSYDPCFSAVGLGTGDLAGLTSKDHPPYVQGPLAAGGFVAVLPNFSGAGAVIALDDGYWVNGAAGRPQWQLALGPHLGARQVKKGEQLHYRLLVGRGLIGGPSTDQEWRDFIKKMGLAGPPAYTVAATQGAVLSTKYLLEAQAENGGFAANLSRADLPVRLPICVQGVNPRWTAGIVDLKTGAWQPVGVVETERQAYTTWEAAQGPTEIYVGNLVSCDSPDLILTATVAGKQWTVEAHNPTDHPVTATVKGAPKFAPLAALARQVTVPAEDSVDVQP